MPKKEELPKEAFAIIGDEEDRETWQMPHHKRSISRALRAKRADIEKTVDWESMPVTVAALSPGGYLGQRATARPEEILRAALHLADHYRKAGQALPDTLAALV